MRSVVIGVCLLQPEKVYVQHLMQQQSELLAKYLLKVHIII